MMNGELRYQNTATQQNARRRREVGWAKDLSPLLKIEVSFVRFGYCDFCVVLIITYVMSSIYMCDPPD
jgi:hypothetical protein